MSDKWEEMKKYVDAQTKSKNTISDAKLWYFIQKKMIQFEQEENKDGRELNEV
ncbi:MAG: hypothetical protein ACTSPB_00630 [Candidatus Thorarchaeota archaeon]